MSGRVQIFVLVLCYVVVLVESISFMDPKVLVVVDNKQLYQSHSMLFSTLEGCVLYYFGKLGRLRLD